MPTAKMQKHLNDIKRYLDRLDRNPRYFRDEVDAFEVFAFTVFCLSDDPDLYRRALVRVKARLPEGYFMRLEDELRRLFKWEGMRRQGR